MIPFKAKAWLDLSARKSAGERIDSKNIKKHSRDIFQLYSLLPIGVEISIPVKIKADMSSFLSAITTENSDVLSHIAEFYGINQ
jgi:hypothetical protein